MLVFRFLTAVALTIAWALCLREAHTTNRAVVRMVDACDDLPEHRRPYRTIASSQKRAKKYSLAALVLIVAVACAWVVFVAELLPEPPR